MVRELSALFQVLRQKKLDFKIIQSGGEYLHHKYSMWLNMIQYNTIRFSLLSGQLTPNNLVLISCNYREIENS